MSGIKCNELIFICDSSLQSSFFRGFLEKSVGITIKNVTIDGLEQLKFGSKQPVLFIMDYSHIDDKSLDLFVKYVVDNHIDSYQVMINTPISFDAAMVSKWPNIVGLFYVGDGLDVVSKGMQKIISGELWLSRPLTQEIIALYRKSNSLTVQPTVKLTTREKEILQLLVMGASNNEIAESLFVSENTVKTHLYNVFKKINVKNRMQAFMWAKNNQTNSLPL
ncbi:LuxR C-terminal-related transcriptional regulator [Photobacterium sp. J15]|uniref:LuxR C-terminal-related transcriptional regulator n=1 Tax=Photobacterium sp. J15 TaxID=265901 RepID=UPI0007E3F680|nr:LuxR C-terminal-related transcriptional regulator [Photobacterium sp. J15]